MKGFIEIPATVRDYEFLINIAQIKTVVAQKEGSKIEYINGTVENLELTYEQVKDLLEKVIGTNESNASIYNNPDVPFTA
ncbi:hypothetical protein Q765_03225 [Flavobacterium rivuli WB 3.3-2 = DSM 21788]|uniref:Uncharacterized protein n=1 Tax=Flavobacterium rivuli WB 3.3-2 = DSM 21788 TaxID=1121895 RepID=A0A0A2M8W4_9FLAO|nr:hypothetical protein [Flavobacterium rivuli]KGO88081.1 hypothetical protein Q765_03225 [Flavobacterium rivuli WB 3.3-2 = DSM 21788]